MCYIACELQWEYFPGQGKHQLCGSYIDGLSTSVLDSDPGLLNHIQIGPCHHQRRVTTAKENKKVTGREKTSNDNSSLNPLNPLDVHQTLIHYWDATVFGDVFKLL